VARGRLHRVTLHLHTGDRTDVLADGLGALLVAPLEDPFAREVVVVPARGVERWLTQRLSHRLGTGTRGGDGVCAGVDFLSPRSLVAMLLDKDADDPWDPDRLAWPLLEVVDQVLGRPGFEALSRHLGHEERNGATRELKQARRYAVARRLAGLFASYAVQRPALVTDWRKGRDTDGAGGDLTRDLDHDLRWQAELWRMLLDRVDAPPPDVRHAETLARLRAGGDGLDLPSRLSLFGHTRLPVSEVALLAALGELRDVHLWLPQVSPALWEALGAVAGTGPVPRAEDDSADLVHHPLLASLGRDSREVRRTLGTVGTASHPAAGAAPRPDTLLGWLQSDLRANDAPDPAGRVLREDDRSVQVHACHGAARQVDVLREVLVGLLEDDPTLEPRDILVMCPDIEAYAPLISAGFGLADVTEEDAGHPAHRLRVRLADRSLGATNPLLGVASTLVELAGGRLTASQVLDLASTGPVRRRFGLGDDELERIARWVRDAGIRWGHDAEHRGDFGLGTDANTWVFGLRRVLLGAAMSGQGHRFVGGSLPVDDVGDGDLALAGAFAELVDRLHAFCSTAREASTVEEWTRAVGEAVHRLTATGPDDAWQVAQLDRELSRIAAGTHAGTTRLRHADVRALLRHRLRGRPTRSNFRTGTLTVCTMVPMRSVPHRVVCLVGLDDGVFPRVQSLDGDDVLARRPLTGERDLRSEDRQLLLDAVAAATETLVVTYTGRGEHTGTPRPPAVPLGELLDALDDTATTPTTSTTSTAPGDRVRDRVLVQHPLQPFDEANLVAGRLVPGTPFTFDTAALAGARAARGPRVEVRELVPAPLPAVPRGDAATGEVALADLHDFFAHPVRGFFRGRLRIARPFDADEVKDGIPIALDHLEQWAVGDRLVRDVLAGAEPQAGMTAELLRGLLPPHEIGRQVLTEVVAKVRPLVTAGLALRTGRERTLDVDVDLGDGRRLTGTVGPVHGNNLVTVSFSNLGARHRIRAWIDALALAAGHPDENWTAHTVGKHRSGGQVAMLSPMAYDDAVALLRRLVAVHDHGLCEPLPLPLKTSLAWAEEHRFSLRGRDAHPDEKARQEWTTPRFNDSGIPREDADAWHVRAFGERAAYDLLATPGRDGETDGPHRLGHYAWQLWGPLLTDGRERMRAV